MRQQGERMRNGAHGVNDCMHMMNDFFPPEMRGYGICSTCSREYKKISGKFAYRKNVVANRLTRVDVRARTAIATSRKSWTK